MASMRRVALAPRALRQLRRVRSVYLVGALLSLLGLLTQEPGRATADGRQAAIAVVLLGVFTVLLGVTVVQLWRHGRTAHCSTARKLTRSF
ncbi:hypothetical protein OG233_05870 [Streptomyces sp. NBC_01218]|uniref:hypothetical protein n=1 Tax=unclassified Streptomyces TaxID=2593676 RepID=UPI0023B9F204|nr:MULTISPECIES: hypothetical protein [unclassified Streptomyces]WEH39083.1 hypothetical protein PZB77_05890 [Streptomyces sp. AM 2-1-1]WSQ50739.1 hypothetical protein OG233_05870 [Streptomyces sp. NBC_01218]